MSKGAQKDNPSILFCHQENNKKTREFKGFFMKYILEVWGV